MKTLETIPLLTDVNPQLVACLNRNVKRLRVENGPYAITTDYTFQDTDTINSLQIDATAAARTVTLPSPTGSRRRRIIKTDSSANTVTIVGTINGAVNYTLTAQYSWIEVEPTGAAWLIVGADFGFYNGYSEGTWTPSVGGSATYTTRIGHYTRIGRVVHLSGRLKINILGTGSASTVSGLPFTANNAASALHGGTVPFWGSLAASYVFVGCFAVVNTTTLTFTGATAATASISAAVGILQDGADVMFALTYTV